MHAGVATKALEREKLERICRYIARPAVAKERLSLDDRGDVIYRFKKPWSDGTSAIKLTPLELMERLAALVPRPRVHLTRFHGVLASHYKAVTLVQRFGGSLNVNVHLHQLFIDGTYELGLERAP